MEALFLSFKLALVTTIILLVSGVWIAYRLSQTQSRWKPFAESFLSLPIILPPSVLGYYLLIAFSPESLIGEFLHSWFNIRLAFTFPGLVIASVIYSLPFMVHPIQSGFQNLPPSLKDASYTLGISPFRTFIHVLLPNIKPALLSGVVLTFAHTVGEFGVVLMIGGSIPGQTKVASISLYEAVESMNYNEANFISLILISVSFLFLLLLFLLNKNKSHRVF